MLIRCGSQAAVASQASGRWSVAVALRPGLNVFVIQTRDQDGAVTDRQRVLASRRD